MKTDTDEKSFDPQLLPDGEPTSEWGIDQLGVYAQMQHRRIVDGEKSLTAVYWRLGHGLSLALKDLPRGHRAKYIEKLGIDKTRVSKARAIYRTFDDEDKVKGLSVEEAYALRKRKQAGNCKESATEVVQQNEVKTVSRFAASVSKHADELMDIAGFAEPDDAASLIPAVRGAIARLMELLKHLERQAESQPAIPPAKDDPVAQEARTGESRQKCLMLQKNVAC